jgi:hypothetical protein
MILIINRIMVASLLKVICSGIQDERIHFKGTMYPFSKVWIKAGRFTTQWVRIDFDNVPQFGQTGYFTIKRIGHLCTRLYLVAQMPDIYSYQLNAINIAGPDVQVKPHFGYTNSLGHALIDRLTLDIATDRVETIDSRLLEIIDEFNTPLEKVPVVNKLIKRADNGFSESSFGNSVIPEQVIVPLPYWFTRGDTGCALPIDAIPMDIVRGGIKFRNFNGLYYTESRNVGNSSSDDGTSLWPIVGSSFYKSDMSGGEYIPGISSNVDDLYSKINGISMPQLFQLGECYIMAEYVYLDQPEANRFRLADLQIPIVQHYNLKPYDSRGLMDARIRINVPNPCRNIYFMANRVEAPSYNAHFLGTRDLNGNVNTRPSTNIIPWWPDAIGLSSVSPGPLIPAFSLSDSEPLSGYELDYEGNIVRFRTESSALFRSIIPSYEQRKTPWVNRYYYNFSFGIQNGFTPFSNPLGEANLDKINKVDLVLKFRPSRGCNNVTEVPEYVIYIYAETYNILRVYSGRAGLLFPY